MKDIKTPLKVNAKSKEKQLAAVSQMPPPSSSQTAFASSGHSYHLSHGSESSSSMLFSLPTGSAAPPQTPQVSESQSLDHSSPIQFGGSPTGLNAAHNPDDENDVDLAAMIAGFVSRRELENEEDHSTPVANSEQKRVIIAHISMIHYDLQKKVVSKPPLTEGLKDFKDGSFDKKCKAKRNIDAKRMKHAKVGATLVSDTPKPAEMNIKAREQPSCIQAYDEHLGK